MSDCCRVSSNIEPPLCPECGHATKPVQTTTVKSLVRPEALRDVGEEPWFFCGSPDCSTVYVTGSGTARLEKREITVRVGVKETEDPIPVCYCFGFDRAAIEADIRRTGETEIRKEITARVKAGECRCETMNPSGRCCLGDVGRAIAQAKKRYGAELKETT